MMLVKLFYGIFCAAPFFCPLQSGGRSLYSFHLLIFLVIRQDQDGGIPATPASVLAQVTGYCRDHYTHKISMWLTLGRL